MPVSIRKTLATRAGFGNELNNSRKRLFAFYVSVVVFFAMYTGAHAGPTVIASGAYPEGLLWHGGRLFFAEMGSDRISVVDGVGKKEFWRDSDCGPTALSPFGTSAFLVNCHLGKQVVEISADGVTLRRFFKAADGGALQAPNASVSDGRGVCSFQTPAFLALTHQRRGAWFTCPPQEK